MKIIFLDIDGVLNTSLTFKRIQQEYDKNKIYHIEIDKFRLEYLKNIIDNTSAKIVLSSSWKLFFYKDEKGIIPTIQKTFILNQLLKKYGLEIFDLTPIDTNGCREKEIEMWLNENENIENFIIIDDNLKDLSKIYTEHLIKTKFTLENASDKTIENTCGLCNEHVVKAISILNKNYVKKLKL